MRDEKVNLHIVNMHVSLLAGEFSSLASNFSEEEQVVGWFEKLSG